MLTQTKPTSPLVWLAAILCSVIAVAVIITGLVIFAVYIIYQPKMPYLKVPYAHLNKLDYDQSGLLEIEMALTIVAVNDNSKAQASFSGTSFDLRFHRVKIGELLSDPFDVAKNSSFALNYVVPSSQIPLDKAGMEEIDAALKQGRVSFGLEGQARTRWRVGIFLSVKFWTHLSCRLQFAPSNGSSIDLHCSSKTR